MPATEFHDVYKASKPVVDEIRKQEGIRAGDDFYQLVLKAAFIKSYEFNTYASGLEAISHSFYLTATLRGMCEDIIVLKSIAHFDPKDRSDFVIHSQMEGVFESLTNQERFFKANRSGQPIYTQKDTEIKRKEETNKLLDLYRKYGFLTGKQKKVTVRQLAESCGLLSVYEFFYSATSKWVHFSPQILMRMGWANEKSPLATYIFSTEHFSGHYANFNFIYGSYLFTLFFDYFKNELPDGNKIGRHINEIKELLNKILRWPELITFEEMNVEPPSLIIYGLMKVIEEKGIDIDDLEDEDDEE